MTEPPYSFTLPSIYDDTPLDCRIYQLNRLGRILDHGLHTERVKSAILAHPYAPLGGCFDDQIVLTVTETLVKEGFIVGTFNFRGAEGSQGRSTWTGKGEQEDYITFIWFMMNYLRTLQSNVSPDALEPVPTETGPGHSRDTTSCRLLLGGYSYGSLVLARLPTIQSIILRLGSAEAGSAAAEVVLRADTLAKQTVRTLADALVASSPRGRQLGSRDSTATPRNRYAASPVVLGGEESDPSTRRRSRESKRSMDAVRKSAEVPRRIKAAVIRNSITRSQEPNASMRSTHDNVDFAVSAQYLLISPVLMPFSHTLLPPGPPSSVYSFKKQKADDAPGVLFLKHPTLAIFGTSDVFTSGRRLKGWAEKQASESESRFEWTQIDGAGHFWREDGVMQALQARIGAWVRPS